MAEMSAVERWLVNSPFRAWLQRREVRAFIRWAELSPSPSVLDMGCGRGVSSKLILEQLRPKRLASPRLSAAARSCSAIPPSRSTAATDYSRSRQRHGQRGLYTDQVYF